MPHKIHRPRNDELQDLIARTREVVAASLEVLRQPCPDTFLGRQHHEQTPPRCGQETTTATRNPSDLGSPHPLASAVFADRR